MTTTNWIDKYSKTAAKPKLFQEGGAMAPPAPAPGPGGEPMAPEGAPQGGPDLEGMIAEYAQSRDPQLAVAICDAIVEMMAAQGGGGGAPMARAGMKLKRGPVFKK